MLRRTQLRRRTALKRSGTLRPVSHKRAKAARAVGVERQDFLYQFDRCAFPGCTNQATCVHEIAFGSGIRPRAIKAIEAWLPSCVPHNTSGQGFHNPKLMPIVDQCAVKKFIDPTNYNVAMICQLRFKAVTDITEAEVEIAFRRIYGDSHEGKNEASHPAARRIS